MNVHSYTRFSTPQQEPGDSERRRIHAAIIARLTENKRKKAILAANEQHFGVSFQPLMIDDEGTRPLKGFAGD